MSELMNANELPRNTGLLNLVKSRYTSVPTPAPRIADGTCVGSPIATGTAMVAAMMASSCCTASTISFMNGGLSLMS